MKRGDPVDGRLQPLPLQGPFRERIAGNELHITKSGEAFVGDARFTPAQWARAVELINLRLDRQQRAHTRELKDLKAALADSEAENEELSRELEAGYEDWREQHFA